MLRHGRWFTLALLLGAVTFCGVSAYATAVGADITFFDNRNAAGGNANGDYGGATNPDTRDNAYFLGYEAVREDFETEPGTVTGQQWDLEGMYYNSSNGMLSLVGGFNFAAGLTYGSSHYSSGDIFLAVNPAMSPPNTDMGAGYPEPPNPDGSDFDYVIHFALGGSGNPTGAYTIYAIAGLTTGGGGLDAVSDIPGSNALRINAAGIAASTLVYTSGTPATFGSSTDSADLVTDGYFGSDPGLLGSSLATGGTTHYVMQTINLSSWGLVPSGSSANIYLHYTYSCGNDDLAGYVRLTDSYDDDPVPEPSSLTLLGLGLAAAAAFRIRKSRASRV